MSAPGNIGPMDDHNKRLIDNVHPPDWANPEPADKYNIVVIGAGTAGLVAAAGAAGVGAKVALAEKDLMGGDCLNSGCVPSKSVIRAARAAFDARDAARFGVTAGNIDIDFTAAMERMREVRSRISSNDSARRFKGLGVDVFIGEASFCGPDCVKVGDKTLRFKKAAIATGARPLVPPVPGLEEAGYLTNETVFNLVERPRRLAVLGGGPIGVELAQSFQRLGSEVVIVEQAPQFLVREDRDAADILAEALRRDGVRVMLGSLVERVETSAGGKELYIGTPGGKEIVEADEILVAAGRAPNVEGLNLDAIGVEYDKFGIRVDDRLRTANPNIYAAGDVAMKHKFTHAADFAARIVIQNALFKGRKKLSALNIPWTTYTDPEIARIGLNEREAAEAGIEVDTYKKDFADVDRAIAEGEEDGFVKILARKGTGEIVGATIVARSAGDMIGEISVAMAGKVGLGAIASAIHPYPTRAEAIRRIGDMYNRTRFTPRVAALFGKWLEWTR